MPITDVFTGTNGAAPESDWNNQSGGPWEIWNNGVRPTDDYSTSLLIRTENAFPDNQYAQVRITIPTGVSDNPANSIAIRVNSSGNGYQAVLDSLGVTLQRGAGGTYITDTPVSGLVAGNSYLVKIEAIGTTIKVYVDSGGGLVERISVTDSTYTSGKPALRSVTGSTANMTVFDDFECTDAVTEAPRIVEVCGGYASTTGLAPAFPKHRANDVILLAVQTANQSVSLSDAQGFAEIGNVGTGTAGSSTATRLTLFWKRASGTSEAAPTFADPGDHIFVRCYVIRGCVTTGNPWVGYATDTASSSTSVTWPSLSSGVDKNQVFNFLATPTDQRTGREFARAYLSSSRYGYERGASYLFQSTNFGDEDTAARDVRRNLLFGGQGAAGLFSGAANASLTNIVEVTDAATNIGNGGSVILVRAERATSGAVGGTTGTLATAAVQARFVIAFSPNAVTGAYTLTADPGSYTITGNAAGTLAARKIVADPGSYAITGNAAGLSRVYRMTADTGVYSLTGNAAGTLATRRITADPGSYTLTGNAAGTLAARRITANTGSYALTGNAANLIKAFRLAANTGNYTLTGVDAGLRATRRITADAGAYSITGIAAGLIRGRRMTADTGSYTVTGNAANLLLARKLVANTGSYTITGNAAGLNYGSSLTLTADPGSYTVTGNDAGLRVTRRLAADTGAYALTGNAAALVRALRMAANTGTYTVTGTAANLVRTRALTAATGNYAITGNAAGTLATRKIVANTGAYTLTGIAAELRRGRTLTADPGSFTLTGNAAALRAARVMTALTGSYTITGNAAGLNYVSANPVQRRVNLTAPFPVVSISCTYSQPTLTAAAED